MNRPTFMQRINRRLDAHRNGEAGLALLDVLLGMAIFALIAVIAVQAMGQFRERAFVTQATSDAKQAGTGIEAAMTEPNATFAGILGGAIPTATTELTGAQKTALGVNSTGTNRIFVTGSATAATGAPVVNAVATPTNETNYVLCVDNGEGSTKKIEYRAAVGAVGAPTTGDCTP